MDMMTRNYLNLLGRKFGMVNSRVTLIEVNRYGCFNNGLLAAHTDSHSPVSYSDMVYPAIPAARPGKRVWVARTTWQLECGGEKHRLRP